MLVVAQVGDPHADAVETQLAVRKVSFARTSLNAWSEQTVEWSPGGTLLLGVEGRSLHVGQQTTVWWRRPGWFESDDVIDSDELKLAQDEAAVMLPGALQAAGVRWVDSPWQGALARNRLVQLALAKRLGICLPATVVTNSTSAAMRFVDLGTTVAKAISTGPGLAPFVDQVELSDLELVANAPVLLQRVVRSDADWRVVTVGSAAFCWRRPRDPDQGLDWRAEDPAGALFRRVAGYNDLERLAVTMQDALGLSFSVQDWLQADGIWFFLEVNPQGQWLFLDGADQEIGAALALHLVGGAQVG